ncbi:MAG: GxxExxY protein [Polyangiaceae bacterium]|nr:GxxExxY protein [Polyangiaceae bacterium]
MDFVEPDRSVDVVAHAVIGAAIEVHRHLGPGFPEAVYEEALCAEMAARGIAFARQVPIIVQYKGSRVGEARLDLLVGGCLIVELKAVELSTIHGAQLSSYLKAARLQIGLLITFDVTVLRKGIRRIIASR